jgi:radical SAM protein with 4Fe4S-binding SPASM domain
MGAAADCYSVLAISEEEKLQAGERLARRLQRGQHCNVQCEALSLLGKIYVNAKYGLSLPLGRGGCDAVTSKAYVQPDGALFPCQDVAREIGRQTERQHILHEGVSIWSSDRYAPIAHGVSSLSVYERYTPCNRCPALGTVCTPCPLPGIRGQRTVHQACLLVLGRAEQEGIDLTAGITSIIRSSFAERIIESPVYRRRLFSSSEPVSVLAAEGAVHGDAASLARFRDDTLAEVRQLLAQAALNGSLQG